MYAIRTAETIFFFSYNALIFLLSWIISITGVRQRFFSECGVFEYHEVGIVLNSPEVQIYSLVPTASEGQHSKSLQVLAECICRQCGRCAFTSDYRLR